MEDLVNSSRLPFDIRGEVLGRLLLEHYDLSVEQVLFRPGRFHQRWGRRDVLEVSEDFSFTLDKKTLWIDLCREGLYDILPESLFLHPDEKYPDNVAKSEALTEQEAAARKLLLPFEQLFYWLRLENEIEEKRVEDQLESWWQEQITGSVSAVSSPRLEPFQREILTYLIPNISNVVGNCL